MRSARGWLAIDPKGVIGEPAYEVGALLRNPIPRIFDQPDRPTVLRRRARLLADALGFDAGRVLRWAAVQAVLSAWWDVEDGAPDTVRPWITPAEEPADLAQRPNLPAR